MQEDRLLGVVGGVLAAPSRPAFERLRRAWRVRNVATFDAAMQSIATQLAAAAIDRETVDERGFTPRVRAAGSRPPAPMATSPIP